MKTYFIISTILLVGTGVAGAFESPANRYSIAVNNINDIIKTVDAARSEARLKKETIKFVCISDAAHAIYAFSKRLNIKPSNPDPTDVMLAEEIFNKVTELATAAYNCKGHELIYINSKDSISTSVDLHLDGELIPSYPLPLIAIEPPACASCFR